jgi:hypothetical protein
VRPALREQPTELDAPGTVQHLQFGGRTRGVARRRRRRHEQLLVKPLRLGLGRRGQFALEDIDRRPPPALSRVQPHQRPVDRLLGGVEAR